MLVGVTFFCTAYVQYIAAISASKRWPACCRAA
jgi:hypothetical protein